MVRPTGPHPRRDHGKALLQKHQKIKNPVAPTNFREVFLAPGQHRIHRGDNPKNLLGIKEHLRTLPQILE